MNRILYIGFDQLNLAHGVLQSANPDTDTVLLVESARMLENPNWHSQRIFFLISSARHFAEELKLAGFQTLYTQAPTTIDGILKARQQTGIESVLAAAPNSYRMTSNLLSIGVELTNSDFFLTDRNHFLDWAKSQKNHVMENFYRLQRKRLGYLMDGDAPVGGEWNFDKENRLPPPKNHSFPVPPSFEWDAIDKQVIKEISGKYWGAEPKNYWATTRAGALRQLDFFVNNVLAGFGPYEDAMPIDSWSVNHSLLSPYLNNGLLHPLEVVDAAIEKFEKGQVPINSIEGFVRQVIGWREYINGMYWYFGEDYRNQNHLAADRKLLPLYRDPTKTEMNCVRSVIEDVHARGWAHHIPRLMVLSNLALITGTDPQEYLDWMREVFIDAADWVMVPNVIGMGVHADGGLMMTKPYAAGGAYISKMSNYCKGCRFNPKSRTDEDSCPFTTLYWDFIDRNLDEFKSNHRMFQQTSGLKRLSDLPETRDRAKFVLDNLSSGNL
jgi:deoxyribodipyrimidine photolyase-related protein